MRIAILGGTFDPVHNEHVEIAKKAIAQLQLDKLIVMPTFMPPHKDVMPTDGEDRLNMLDLAFRGIDKVEISDYEIKKQGKSYTYLTVEHFKNKDTTLYFIVGLDMLIDFKNWKYPERILDNCTLVTFGREGYSENKESEYFKKTFNKEFIRLNYTGKNISSTKIRVYASLGLDISNFVCRDVQKYIQDNKLYNNAYAEFVKKRLTEKRLIHTAGVIIAALKKAKELKLNYDKVYTAAVLHDVAKYIDYKSVQGFTIDSDVPEPVIHAFLGAYIVEKYLGITDAEIIDAIRYHTSGKANMTVLGKLIFLADMVEDNRTYEGVEKLRELYYKDFNECFIESLKEELLHLKNKGQHIYRETINAYDYYIKDKGEKYGI